MYLGKVYIHHSFLERVFLDITNSLQDVYSYISEESENQYLRDLIFFIKRSDLVIDLTPEEIISSTNPIIKLIAKSPAVKLFPNPRVFEELKNETFFEKKYFDFFFLDMPKTFANDLEKKYGVLIFTPENYRRRLYLLFGFQELDIKKHQHAEKLWRKISKQRHPISSLILVDNYILTNNISGIQNIAKIISSIQSSSSLKKDLCITVFTVNEVSKENQEDLTEELKTLDLNANVSLVKLDTWENHDRNIYTDYFRITSGHGFDVVRINPKSNFPVIIRETNIFIRPYSLINDRNSFLDFKKNLIKLRRIYMNARLNKDPDIKFVGGNKNQLLEIDL